MSWDEVAKQTQEALASQDGVFIKLKDDGQNFQGVVIGEPDWFLREGEYEGKVSKSKRFMINVFLPGKGMKIWEMNATTMNVLLRKKASFDFAAFCLCVDRVGKARDKLTTYQLSKGDAISPELARQATASTPHNLREHAERSAERDSRGDGERQSYSHPTQRQTAQQQMSVNEKDLPF